MFLSTHKKVTGVWNSEVGSMKPREKAKDILFHPWNTTYIFTAVKIQLFIFSQLWNTAFLKYALYLIHNFLYFITLYIINVYIRFHLWYMHVELCWKCICFRNKIINNKKRWKEFWKRMRVPRHLRAENLALHYRLLEAQTEASPQSSVVSQSKSENFSCLDRTSDDSSHRLRAKKVSLPPREVCRHILS